MSKNFWEWHNRKKALHESKMRPFFNEKEVWFAAIGLNIGYEQDGGKDYLRPVLILKKFNNELFWGVPISTTSRRGEFYCVVEIQNRIQENVAVLSQLKVYDGKRLEYLIGSVSDETIELVKQKIRQFIA